MITVYGIPNCSSVKKTRVWLDAAGIGYAFHDFKKLGIDEATLKHWLTAVPLGTLINKKGSTWRGLSPTEQAMANEEASAIQLMVANTSLIKRPVMVWDKGMFVGHDEALLTATFI